MTRLVFFVLFFVIIYVVLCQTSVIQTLKKFSNRVYKERWTSSKGNVLQYDYAFEI